MRKDEEYEPDDVPVYEPPDPAHSGQIAHSLTPPDGFVRVGRVLEHSASLPEGVGNVLWHRSSGKWEVGGTSL